MMPNDLSGGHEKRVSLAGQSPWTRRLFYTTNRRPGSTRCGAWILTALLSACSGI